MMMVTMLAQCPLYYASPLSVCKVVKAAESSDEPPLTFI